MQKSRAEQRLIYAQNEFGDDINFTIQDSAGNVRDLTGITPAFQVWIKSRDLLVVTPPNQITPRGLTFIIDADCTIVNAVAGQCKYTVKQGDFAMPGIYYAKLILKTGTTKKESTERFLVVVQE